VEETIEDDGLITPVVGPWSLRKYELIEYYTHLFATGMKKKWDCRVYIDLFAGAGRSMIQRTNKVVLSSPMLALKVHDFIDKYIFCEIDSENFVALQERVQSKYPHADVSIIQGDTNENVQNIIDLIPQSSPQFSVLSFCFADPYKMANLKFATIELLAKYRMDFLVLIPSYMDAVRNRNLYSHEESIKVENFMGDPSWRIKWERAEVEGKSFAQFFLESFGRQMESLGYLNDIHVTVLVRHGRRPLYHLAFFSKHERGMDFWRKARKGTDPQRTFAFD